MMWTPSEYDKLRIDESDDEVPEIASAGQRRHTYLQRLGVGAPRSHALSAPEAAAENDGAPELGQLGQDTFRAKFLQKLAYNNVWVPQAHRPPKHQSVILFDWDDTLLCTSWLNRQQVLTDDVCEHLRKIAVHVRQLLEVALKSGNTYIITNATTGWVEYSAAKWVPEVLPILRQVQVISARDKFKATHPDVNQWKVQAFLEVQRRMDAMPITNLVALGDADFEMEAVRIMGGEFNEALIKTIKFRPHPSPLEHLREVELVAQRFEQIVCGGRGLKIFLERRNHTKQQPSAQVLPSSE